jgi:hypothetical protein
LTAADETSCFAVRLRLAGALPPEVAVLAFVLVIFGTISVVFVCFVFFFCLFVVLSAIKTFILTG